MKNLRILIKNILNTLLFLFVINFTIVFSYSLYTSFRSQNNIDSRTRLEVYLPHTWSSDHFKELGQVKVTYTSYLGYRRLPFKGSTINIDEKGIRNTLNQTNKKGKVFFYGGSTTWGTGVPDSLTIPSLFNKFSNFNHHVINYGESGYHSFQEYLKFLIHIQKDKLSPDIVIFYDGVNEFSFLEKGNHYVYSNPVENRLKKLYKGQTKTNNLSEYLKSIFLNPLFKVITRLTKKSEVDVKLNINRSESFIKDVVDNTIQNWILSKNLAERNNIKPYFILQPNIYTSTYNDKYIPLNKDRDSVYKKYYTYLKEELKKKNFEYYDLSDIFKNEKDIYIDFCHLTPKGNKIVSKRIYEIINRL
jgi:lysophospholipase L1-like esterase